jgi:exosortase
MPIANKNISPRAIATSARSSSPLFALCFAALCLIPFALAWDLTRGLSALVLTNDTFSHIPLIPLVSAYLIYANRDAIFSHVSFEPVVGSSILVPGIILVIVARLNIGQLPPTNRETLFVLGTVCVWVGSFITFGGTHAFRSACFPLLFLLFAVPIPEPVLSYVISFLQRGSADVAEAFLNLGGVPYLRHDLMFALPGVSIRVAEECSGIRSTLALLITTALASYLFLKTGWRRMILVLAVVPMAIIKNGLRIAGLTLLSIYVDPGFLTGNLHRRGGIVFFVIALVPMALLLILLERGEKPTRSQQSRENLAPEQT